MEPTSQAEDYSPLVFESLQSQIREMYGRAAYTHKTHEKMADRYIRRYRLVKVFEIGLSAVATSSLILAVFGDSRIGTIVGALLSTVLLGITLYFKEGNLGEQAQKHSAVASRLWGVRERLLSLLVDMSDGRAIIEVRRLRDELNEILEQIYKNAPRTSSAAYNDAQKALKSNEELFFSDDELNRMLPKKLRIPNKPDQ